MCGGELEFIPDICSLVEMPCEIHNKCTSSRNYAIGSIFCREVCRESTSLF